MLALSSAINWESLTNTRFDSSFVKSVSKSLCGIFSILLFNSLKFLFLVVGIGALLNKRLLGKSTCLILFAQIGHNTAVIGGSVEVEYGIQTIKTRISESVYRQKLAHILPPLIKAFFHLQNGSFGFAVKLVKKELKRCFRDVGNIAVKNHTRYFCNGIKLVAQLLQQEFDSFIVDIGRGKAKTASVL